MHLRLKHRNHESLRHHCHSAAQAGLHHCRAIIAAAATRIPAAKALLQKPDPPAGKTITGWIGTANSPQGQLQVRPAARTSPHNLASPAGKTTIVKRINGEDTSTVSPTLGFNIKTMQFHDGRLNIWDVGGQKTLRSYWRNYYEQVCRPLAQRQELLPLSLCTWQSAQEPAAALLPGHTESRAMSASQQQGKAGRVRWLSHVIIPPGLPAVPYERLTLLLLLLLRSYTTFRNVQAALVRLLQCRAATVQQTP